MNRINNQHPNEPAYQADTQHTFNDEGDNNDSYYQNNPQYEHQQHGITIQQSVAILVDGNNIERCIHQFMDNDSAVLNYDQFIPRVVGVRQLNKLYYFREGKYISQKLTNRLHRNFYGQTVPCYKNAQVSLTIKATQLAHKADTIILFTGDADYVDLVKYLKNSGVRVEIASVKYTTNTHLYKLCDYYHVIDKDNIFSLRNKEDDYYSINNNTHNQANNY